MKFLLSFAVGAILGDIFFHLIPESLHSYLVELNVTHQVAHKKVGLSILAGIFMFIIVEMILEKWSHPPIEETKETSIIDTNDFTIDQKSNGKDPLGIPPIFYNTDLKQNKIKSSATRESFNEKITENNNDMWTDLNAFNETKEQNNNVTLSNKTINNNYERIGLPDKNLRLRKRQENTVKGQLSPTTYKDGKETVSRVIDAAGYLSLIANGFDNFTHGLAIGASFLVGAKVGVLTTFVIFIHEIPHEICDYAILVNSGFSRWEAVKAQSSVSLFGILGTATALYVKSVQTLTAKTVWILPFSAGGFLYIALVNLLPEILDQRAKAKDSLGQAVCVILGIIFMASVAVF